MRKFMGKETVTTWWVTEYEPNQKMAFKVIQGPMPFEGAFILQSVDGSTSLVYKVQAELTSLLIEGLGKNQMSALKRALESQR